MSETSPQSVGDLAALILEWNRTTARLTETHAVLKEKVALLQRELAEKNREIERKGRLAALGEMAAGVAHEIRNPLGAVRLYASLLERDLAGQEKPAALVRKLLEGARLIDTIVEDMLAFTRARPPALRRASIGAILDAALALAERTLAERRVVVVRGAPPRGAPEVMADADLLARAFLNVIQNAADALAATGGTLAIAVARRPPGRVTVSFADSGPGIEPAAIDRIFDPFYTTRDKGVGLGLAIVHRILEDHGGRVGVASEPGKGATFHLTLPLAPRERPAGEPKRDTGASP